MSTRVDDEFFGRVGHDLRGELSTMLAGVHFLLRYEQGLAPSAREMLERVNGAGLRLKRLLDEFGNCVWLDATAPRQLAFERCELEKICAAAVERGARSAVARSVTPVVEVSNAHLEADAEVLVIALEYVIDLAVTRSRDQRVLLTAGAEDGRAIVTVTDEAGPLAEERLGALLDPFVEREAIPKETPARRRERLGLGLTIAAGILEAHGGALRVELSPEKNGLSFRCDLGRVI